jgi:hypothetical protein
VYKLHFGFIIFAHASFGQQKDFVYFQFFFEVHLNEETDEARDIKPN